MTTEPKASDPLALADSLESWAKRSITGGSTAQKTVLEGAACIRALVAERDELHAQVHGKDLGGGNYRPSLAEQAASDLEERVYWEKRYVEVRQERDAALRAKDALIRKVALDERRLALAEAVCEAAINMRITGRGHSDAFEDDSDGTLVKALEAWRAGRET